MSSVRLGSMTILVPAPTPTTNFAPMWLVHALGYGAEEGLDVQIDVERGGSPKAAVEGVIVGRGDTTFVNVIFTLLARDRGKPLRPFYAFVRSQNRSFTVPRNSSIRSLDDLRGKTIGLHYADPELFAFAKAVLVGAGLNPEKDVTLTPLPGAPLDAERMATALRNGEVQAVWQLDVLSGLMEAEGVPLRHLPSKMIDSLTPSSTLCALDDSLAARPEAFGALGRAVAKATIFALTNPEAAIHLVWRAFPTSAPRAGEDAERVFKRELAALKIRLKGHRIDNTLVPKWGAITEGEMSAWQDFLLATKAIRLRRAPTTYFSDTLVPHFNAFDAAPVLAQARNFQLT